MMNAKHKITTEQRPQAAIDMTDYFLTSYFSDWRYIKVLSIRKQLKGKYNYYGSILSDMYGHENEPTIAQKIRNGLYFLRRMAPITEIVKRIDVQEKVVGRALSGNLFQNAIMNTEYLRTIKIISENSFRMQNIWKQVVQNHSLVEMGKRIQEQQQALTAMWKRSVFDNITPADYDRWNRKVGQVVAIAAKVEEKKSVSREDFEELKNFIGKSFDKLNETVEKQGKSPIVRIGFWLGVLAFLLSVYTTYTQQQKTEIQRPATEEQVQELKQLIETRLTNTVEAIGKKEIIRISCQMGMKPSPKLSTSISVSRAILSV